MQNEHLIDVRKVANETHPSNIFDVTFSKLHPRFFFAIITRNYSGMMLAARKGFKRRGGEDPHPQATHVIHRLVC